jgi:hypothetical protein
MFTAEQAKEMFEWSKQEPGRWMAVVQTLLVDVIEEHNKTRRGASVLAKESREFTEFFKMLKAQHMGGSAEVAGDAPAEAPLPPRGGVRLGADGEPLDAERAAIEAQMDAAIGVQPPAQVAPSRNGNGPRRQAPAAPTTRLGADGQPLDDAQAAIEAQMDEAAGPRQS